MRRLKRSKIKAVKPDEEEEEEEEEGEEEWKFIQPDPPR